MGHAPDAEWVDPVRALGSFFANLLHCDLLQGINKIPRNSPDLPPPPHLCRRPISLSASTVFTVSNSGSNVNLAIYMNAVLISNQGQGTQANPLTDQSRAYAYLGLSDVSSAPFFTGSFAEAVRSKEMKLARPRKFLTSNS